jgi:hypothetical protein
MKVSQPVLQGSRKEEEQNKTGFLHTDSDVGVKQSDEIQNIHTRTLTGCDRDAVVHEMKSYSFP